MMLNEETRWRRVRLRLLFRRLLDPGLGVFGADAHRYRLNPPVTIEQLRDFESLHSVTLPSDYRQFLLEAGNGGAGPYYGLLSLDASPVYGDLAKPFALTEAWSMADCKEPEDEVPSAYRDGCLAISEHGCGYWSFLVVTGVAAGTVWDDFTCGGTGIHPTGLPFAKWYLKWLALFR
jgi:SMI1 / KNR4 family (SUKH-1)